MRVFLSLRRLKIHNANAMGCPYIIGFPAMTAWLGAVHALERKLRQAEGFSEIRLPRLAISCLDFNLQTYKGPSDRVNSVIITANPLRKKGSVFERPAFIEEARVHLEVSFLIEVMNLESVQYENFKEQVHTILPIMKMASGDIMKIRNIDLLTVDDAQSEKEAIYTLMPGYVLLERKDLLSPTEKNTAANSLDMMLDYLALHYALVDSVDGNESQWKVEKKTPGWLVPIAVGYKGISPLGHVENPRESITPHRFVESIMTLGEFKMPHHIKKIENMMWQYHYDEANDLYLCENEGDVEHGKEN